MNDFGLTVNPYIVTDLPWFCSFNYFRPVEWVTVCPHAFLGLQVLRIRSLPECGRELVTSLPNRQEQGHDLQNVAEGRAPDLCLQLASQVRLIVQVQICDHAVYRTPSSYC